MFGLTTVTFASTIVGLNLPLVVSSFYSSSVWSPSKGLSGSRSTVGGTAPTGTVCLFSGFVFLGVNYWVEGLGVCLQGLYK